LKQERVPMYNIVLSKIMQLMMTYLNTCHTRFNYKFNVTKAMDVAHVD
jgi:hypothetical protein